MGLSRDKMLFCFQMARHTAATFPQCQRLLRLAASLHRFDVERCNRKETEAHKAKIARLQKTISGLCVGINGIGCKKLPVFTYEPMACAVVIQTPDGANDQAGEPRGIGVPA